MSRILKPFQDSAVNQLLNSVSMMLDNQKTKNVCILKSPTGSGKTFMAAAFFESLIRRREDEICCIWITIGKGELQIQSRNALERFFQGNPSVHLVEDEFNGDRLEIFANEVIVVNWEKIRSKERSTGAWSNNVMKEGDRTNFREVVEFTRKLRKVVLIIDESHIGATSERTQELREEFDPNVILEISATPKFLPSASEISNGNAAWIEVDPARVIDEGLIKKSVILNKGITENDFEGLNSENVILESAYQKRLELQKNFDALNVDLNPLVLIQIPNAEEGERKLQGILEFLASKDITESNGRLAIWLHNFPSSENLDGISLNTSPIQFLIFKQAIDTGWDCPRAHILVKFRESKSETFEIQVLGRILRMPEQKHYGIDALNDAYVFTNITDILVKKEEYNPNIVKRLKMQRISNYEQMSLPSYYKSRADYGDITGDFTKVFLDTACKYFGIEDEDHLRNRKILQKKGFEIQATELSDRILVDSVIESELFDEISGEIDSDRHIYLKKSEGDTQAEFNRLLIQHMGTFTNVSRSLPSLNASLFSFFKKYLAQSTRQDAFWLQKTILSETNIGHIRIILESAVSEFAKVKEAEVMKRIEGGELNYIFEIPEEIYVNEFLEEKVDFTKSIMQPCFLYIDRSQVEKTFEEHLETRPDVSWWFKNGVNKIEFLGLKYEYPVGKIRSFYPDYIVKFSDGSIGVFETKSRGNDENFGGFNDKTKAKAESLFAWTRDLLREGRAIRSGIVVVTGNSIIWNNLPVFDLEKAQSGDLSDWKPFV